jgi:uncharacterized protein
VILQAQHSATSVPHPSPESAPFWEGTRLGELRFQRCRRCGHANFGPGRACRACRSRDLRWQASAGTGAVFSWTVVWRPQTPAFDVPYAPAIIRMDEGYDMLSALVGLEPESISVGLRVMAEFVPISEAITLAFFRPLG